MLFPNRKRFLDVFGVGWSLGHRERVTGNGSDGRMGGLKQVEVWWRFGGGAFNVVRGVVWVWSAPQGCGSKHTPYTPGHPGGRMNMNRFLYVWDVNRDHGDRWKRFAG